MVGQPSPPAVVLPHARILWEIGTTTPGAEYVRYNIYRRIVGPSGPSDWVRIATIEDQSVTHYEDYAIPPQTVCEYSVTQSESTSGTLIEADKPDPVSTSVFFNWAYLHNMFDPTDFVVFYALEHDETVEQDIALRQAWGRQAPTPFVGDADHLTMRLRGLSDPIGGSVWASRGLASLQRSSAAIYCLRLGVQGERFFVSITGVSRRVGQRDYSPELQLSEVSFVEEV